MLLFRQHGVVADLFQDHAPRDGVVEPGEGDGVDAPRLCGDELLALGFGDDEVGAFPGEVSGVAAAVGDDFLCDLLTLVAEAGKAYE